MDLSLVLDEEAIPHELRSTGEEQWALFVDDADVPRAQAALAAFELENLPPPPASEPPVVPASAVACGLVFFLSLLALHVWTGPDSAGSPWFARGSADARAI